jgi:sporulation protein YlmC with PRC-barrel domain
MSVAGGGAQQFPEVAFQTKVQNARLTRLLGQRVEDVDGERLGIVRNLILDSQGGQVEYVIVSGFGLPGLSARRIVPAQALSSATAKKDTLALNISKARWEKAPHFKGDLTQLAQPISAREISEFYFPTARGSAKSQPGHGGAHSPPQPARPHHEPGVPPAARSLELASDLLSREVVDSRFKSVGHISDLLVDVTSAKSTVAILSTSTLLSKGPAYAIPLQALSPTGPQLKLQVSRTELTHAQPFTPQAWSLAQGISSAAIYRVDGPAGFRW